MKEHLGSIVRYILLVSALMVGIIWLTGGFAKGKVVVTDTSGHPVEGATVWVSRVSAWHAPAFTTDRHGVAWLTVKDYTEVAAIIAGKGSLKGGVGHDQLTWPLHITLLPETE